MANVTNQVVKVKGREGLLKDPSTNTVFSSKESEYEIYRRNIRKAREANIREQEKDREIAELKERLARLERAFASSTAN